MDCSSGVRRSATRSDLIARGLQDTYTWVIPDGPAEIISALMSRTEPDDTARHRFGQYVRFALDRWQQAGALTYSERPQSSLDAMGRFGAVTIDVRPGPQLRDAADKQRSGSGYLVVPVADCTIDQIISDSAYHSSALPTSEQYRLVLGTFRKQSRPIGLLLGGNQQDTVLKFKALLKYDPFTKSLKFVTADIGTIGADGWQSSNVP